MLPLLCVVAVLAAVLSAVAGVGGGTILIAALYAVGLPPLVALALHAIVQAVSNGTRAWAYRHDVDWRNGGLCAICAGPWPFVVAPWLVNLDANTLRIVLGGFVLANLLPKPARVHGLSLTWRMVIGGCLKGLIGPVVGASGLVLAPFFFAPQWRKEEVVGTLALVQAIGHLVKLAAYSTAGIAILGHWDWALALSLAVVMGTFAGRRVMSQLSQERFERVFQVVLGLLGMQLLLRGVWGLLSLH